MAKHRVLIEMIVTSDDSGTEATFAAIKRICESQSIREAIETALNPKRNLMSFRAYECSDLLQGQKPEI